MNQVKGGRGVDTEFRASLLREVSTSQTPNSAPALIPFCDSSVTSSPLSLPFHLFNCLPYTRPPTWYATPVLIPGRSVVPAAPNGPFQGTDHRRTLDRNRTNAIVSFSLTPTPHTSSARPRPRSSPKFWIKRRVSSPDSGIG